MRLKDFVQFFKTKLTQSVFSFPLLKIHYEILYTGYVNNTNKTLEKLNKARETKYKERLESMEKKTMTMLVATGAGVLVILVLSILQTFTGL